MRRAIKLSYIHDIRLILQDSRFVLVHVEVVWGGEDRHDGGEAGGFRFAVHAVAGVLCFVGADDGEEVVLFEEVAGGGVAGGASANARGGGRERGIGRRGGREGEGRERYAREEIRTPAHMIMHELLRRLLAPKVLQRIAPQNITHQPMRRRLLKPIDLPTS